MMKRREILREVNYEKFCDDIGKIYIVKHTHIVTLNTMEFWSGTQHSKSFSDEYDLEDGTQMIEIDSDTLQSSTGSLVLRRPKAL